MTDTQSELLATRINTGIDFTKKLTSWLLITVVIVGPIWYFYNSNQEERDAHAVSIKSGVELCKTTEWALHPDSFNYGPCYLRKDYLLQAYGMTSSEYEERVDMMNKEENEK